MNSGTRWTFRATPPNCLPATRLELARCDGGTVELSRRTKKLGLEQGDLRITDINDTDQYKPKIKLAGKRLTAKMQFEAETIGIIYFSMKVSTFHEGNMLDTVERRFTKSPFLYSFPDSNAIWTYKSHRLNWINHTVNLSLVVFWAYL